MIFVNRLFSFDRDAVFNSSQKIIKVIYVMLYSGFIGNTIDKPKLKYIEINALKYFQGCLP